MNNRQMYRYCTDCKHWARKKGVGYTGYCTYAAIHLIGTRIETDCLQTCMLDPPQWERAGVKPEETAP